MLEKCKKKKRDLHLLNVSERRPYLKDLKSSNVKDSDEGGSLSLGLVQSFVNSHHQPAEHPLIGGFGQSLDSKLSLLLSLGLLDIVPANLRHQI